MNYAHPVTTATQVHNEGQSSWLGGELARTHLQAAHAAEVELEAIENPGLDNEMRVAHAKLFKECGPKAALAAASAFSQRAGNDVSTHRKRGAVHPADNPTHKTFRWLLSSALAELDRLAETTVARRAFYVSAKFWPLVAEISGWCTSKVAPLVTEWVPPKLQKRFLKIERAVNTADASSVTASSRGKRAKSPKRLSKAEVDVERSYITAMITVAEWARPHFLQYFDALVADFNNASRPSDLPGWTVGAATLGGETEWNTKFRPDLYPLESIGANVSVIHGPTKSAARALVKLLEDYALDPTCPCRPAARYVLDILRWTLVFQDPYALAAMYVWLNNRSELKIFRVKNKLIDESLVPEARTTVLLNAWLDAGGYTGIVEIQLSFKDYIRIKDSMHRYYQFSRAKLPRELLSRPIFELNQALEH